MILHKLSGIRSRFSSDIWYVYSVCMTRKMMSEFCCHVEGFNFAVLVVFGPLKHFKDLLSWSWNGRAQRMATARSQPSSISIGMFQSESVSGVAMLHILRISQSVWNKIGHGGIVCNMYSSTNPCQRFNLMLSDIFAKLGRLHISDRKESWTWSTRCTKVSWSVSGWAAELRDVDMSGYPILLSQCPPDESHISTISPQIFWHLAFLAPLSLSGVTRAKLQTVHLKNLLSERSLTISDLRLDDKKTSQTSDTSLILLSLRRGNQRHKGLEVVSCKWPQTPRAKDAPNTGLGLPHWISFTPAPLGSQTCTFFTSAAQQPHPGKSGRRHGLDLCPGFHGNTGSWRSSINLEHWLTELSTCPWQKETTVPRS